MFRCLSDRVQLLTSTIVVTVQATGTCAGGDNAYAAALYVAACQPSR